MKLKDIVYIFSMHKGSSLSKPDLTDCLPPKTTFNLREEKKTTLEQNSKTWALKVETRNSLLNVQK